MRKSLLALVLAVVAAGPASAGGERADPLRFFEGATESVSTVKVIMKKPYRSRAIGTGRILSNGTLDLVQRVEDEGRDVKTRRWLIRRTGPGRFIGTMSEAEGPVKIDEIDGRYRFRFKAKGGLSVEQWVTPAADGRSATSRISVRKLGLKVGHSEGVIRKIR